MSGKKWITLSPSEQEVIKVLWEEKRPMKVTEIVAVLEQKNGWKMRTIRTFLERLVQKEAVTRGPLSEKENGVNYYEPAFSEEEYSLTAGSSCLEKFFNGSLFGLMACFVDSGEVSDEELRKIRSLIDTKISGKKKK